MKLKILLLLFFPALLFAQSFKLTKDVNTGKPLLIGVCPRTALQDSNFAYWFNGNYNLYRPDSLTLNKINGKIKDYKIKIVMGTWCSDSRREVPRFYKILDYLNFPGKDVLLITVNRKMKGLNDETKGLNIKRIPTFIFYKDDKEVGRIIEAPIETLEKDMEKIVNRKK